MGPSVVWSLKLLVVLALLYGSLVIVRDELERRSRPSTAVYCCIGERRTSCWEEPAFRHFCKYVTAKRSTKHSIVCHQHRVWYHSPSATVIPSPTSYSYFSCPAGAEAHPVAEEGARITTTPTTTLSPADQVEADQRSRQQLIIYQSLMTWTHVSRALVTQEPPPANQAFARKILEVLTAANNLAVRYLANKALKKNEAQDEEAAIKDVMAQRRYCFTCAGKRCKDECLYKIFEEGMPEWKKATARAAREDHEVGLDVEGETNTATLTKNTQEEHRSPGTFFPRRIRTPGQPAVESYSGPTNAVILNHSPPVVSFQNEPVSQVKGESPVTVTDDRTFNTYDCSRPHNLRVVDARGGEHCHYKRPIIHTRDSHYFLMQEVPFRRSYARKCILTRNTLPFYCGVYDHQTVVAPDITRNNPIAISAEDCREYNQRKEYHIKTIQETDKELILEYNLRVNYTNIITYESHGQTLYTGNSEIECAGVEWWSNAKSKKMDDIVEWRSDHLELSEFEEILIDDEDRVTVAGRRLRLPFNCQAQKGECVTREGTWVWPAPEGIAECKFFKIREVSGKEITMSEGTEVKTVFIDDQRLFRLEVKEPVHHCQEEMYTTNYPLLFLFPAARRSTLSDRTIDPDDVDLNLKFDQQDNWIYSYTGRSIEDFAAKTLEMLCLGERQLYTNKYAVLAATQQAVLTGGTVSLGNGQFATIGGEAWHVYQCPKIKVQAIDTEECYDSLPVRLMPQDHDRLVEFELQQQYTEQQQLQM